MSDVWSFGVLVNEVFTFGHLPVCDQTTGRFVIDGAFYHLFPENCPPEVDQLVQACWEEVPNERITAEQLETELKILVRIYEDSDEAWQQIRESRRYDDHGHGRRKRGMSIHTDTQTHTTRVRTAPTPAHADATHKRT